jgi:hypothetical protein
LWSGGLVGESSRPALLVRVGIIGRGRLLAGSVCLDTGYRQYLTLMGGYRIQTVFVYSGGI